jgi:hypothetical protein
MSELTPEKRDKLIEQLGLISTRIAQALDGPARDDLRAELRQLAWPGFLRSNGSPFAVSLMNVSESTENVPAEIAKEMAWLQKHAELNDTASAYAELNRTGKSPLLKRYQDLTVADAEQLVEQHTRMAHDAIQRWVRSRSQRTARTAARHILLGGIYHRLYAELTRSRR